MLWVENLCFYHFNVLNSLAILQKNWKFSSGMIISQLGFLHSVVHTELNHIEPCSSAIKTNNKTPLRIILKYSEDTEIFYFFPVFSSFFFFFFINTRMPKLNLVLLVAISSYKMKKALLTPCPYTWLLKLLYNF